MDVLFALKWIVVFWASTKSSTALDCYICADMEIVVYESSGQDDIVLHLEPGLRDFRCRRPGDSSTSSSRNYQYTDNTNQNYQSPTGPLYPLTCPAPVPGSKEVTRCGAWQGQVHATVFGNKKITFRAFSFGCVDISPKTEVGCHRREANLEEDRKHFQEILYTKFQSNIKVDRFDGYLCFCTDKDCQRTSSASYLSSLTLFALLITTFFMKIF